MYGIIMAGGIGKRFWPMSCKKRPKQFLNLFGSRSMIQMAFDRLQPLINPENIFVITNKNHRKLTEKHLPDLPPENIIGEPMGKDTAPCIGLSALLTMVQDPEAVQVVLPADHLITGVEEFQRIISLGAELASQKDCLITIGIKPNRPETGYGYIQWDPAPAEKNLPKQFNNKDIIKVKTFVSMNINVDFFYRDNNLLYRAKNIHPKGLSK